LAFLPSDVASQVIGQVAFPFYSRLQKDVRQVSLAFRSILVSLSALVVPACALLIALAPSLVENVLGPDWQGTAAIVRVLTLASVVGLLGNTAIPILQGTGRPDRVLILEVIQSSLLLVLVSVLTERRGVIGAAMAWLSANGTTQIAVVVFLHQSLPRSLTGLGRPGAVIATVSGIGAAVALGVDCIVPGVFGLLLAGLTSICLIGSLLWILERRFALGISDGLVRAFPQIAALIGFSPG
jgi:O-antigen/teichoic acid export membrane protein